jgi:hypothetical protein
MQIETEHLGRVRAAVDELKAVVEQEPDAARVGAAWDTVGRVIRALADLAPNHPTILQYTSALAVAVGSRR